MRFAILVYSTLLAAVVSVSAQSLADLPTCADNCVTESLPASCNLDPSCICNTPSFITGISCCVYKTCNATGQAAALAYAHGICDPVGASSLLPATAGCSSTAAANGTTPMTASGANSTMTSTGAVASASSSASSALSSISASASSAAASVSSAASSAAQTASASAASATSNRAPADRLGVQGMGLGAAGAGLLGLAAFL